MTRIDLTKHKTGITDCYENNNGSPGSVKGTGMFHYMKKYYFSTRFPFYLQKLLYDERHLNSRNGPVNAIVVYVCNGYCCSVRNTLLIKFCIPSGDVTTAGNSGQIRFQECLAEIF
jgi:hypothetical protein